MTAISIIGGGRWARTIAGVLTTIPGGPDTITLHSRHNLTGIQDWIAERGLASRVMALPEWPAFDATRPDALIVANRAADHAAAAGPALDAGIPVLVEKPMAIGADAVRRLQERAVAGNAILAASHVVLFARYLDGFAAAVATRKTTRLSFTWEDGLAETVRGETKSYDPAVTVFDDVLPHILPVVFRLTGFAAAPDTVAVENGGAVVTISAHAGNLPVTLRLARNSLGRRRVLTLETGDGPCVLDFSTEPGVITLAHGPAIDGDPAWNSALRPLGTMLTAFLQALRGGPADPRLSPDLAVNSAAFADTVRGPYRTQQGAWLASRTTMDAAREYAVQEISAQG